MVLGVRREGEGMWVPSGTHLFAGSACVWEERGRNRIVEKGFMPGDLGRPGSRSENTDQVCAEGG